MKLEKCNQVTSRSHNKNVARTHPFSWISAKIEVQLLNSDNLSTKRPLGVNGSIRVPLYNYLTNHKRLEKVLQFPYLVKMDSNTISLTIEKMTGFLSDFFAIIIIRNVNLRLALTSNHILTFKLGLLLTRANIYEIYCRFR